MCSLRQVQALQCGQGMSKSQGGNSLEVKSEKSEATDGRGVEDRDLEKVGGSE